MGTCSFCGRSAGFLRKEHSDCREAAGRVTALANSAARGTETDRQLEALQAELQSGPLRPESVLDAALSGWEAAASQAMDDGLLTTEEEHHLADFKDRLGLSEEQVDRNGMWSALGAAQALRDLMEDRVPTVMAGVTGLPFNFKKGETVVWVFWDAAYAREKVRRDYQGGSGGISLRIAKGVYYRRSAFRGTPVEVSYFSERDPGVFAITNKSLYFKGSRTAVRIPFSKVLTFTPYDDGIGVHQDEKNAREHAFLVGGGVGWLACNFVENLARIEREG